MKRIEFYDHSWADFWWCIRHGKKGIGWGDWKGKPYFYIGCFWYDGPHYVLHLYKFHFSMGAH